MASREVKVYREAWERHAGDVQRIREKYDWPRGEYKNPDIELLLRVIDSLMPYAPTELAAIDAGWPRLLNRDDLEREGLIP